jgi:saccharopine dehydrogenase (NADP+, L-glutamate forming)
MTRLVGVTCGVACLRVLDGSIKEKGILAPVTWELAEPLLVELRDKWGIEMVEKTLV